MSAPPSPTVETRTEALRRILSVTAASLWEFSQWEDAPDQEPRVRDTDAAARLGYDRPRDIRKLIERIWPENQRPNCRATVARQPVGPGGKGTREFTVTEYWLTEAQLLKVIARSETPVAEAILDEMIAVYMAVRRHLATTVPVAAHTRELPRPKVLPAPPTPAPARPRLYGPLSTQLTVTLSPAQFAGLAELADLLYPEACKELGQKQMEIAAAVGLDLALAGFRRIQSADV